MAGGGGESFWLFPVFIVSERTLISSNMSCTFGVCCGGDGGIGGGDGGGVVRVEALREARWGCLRLRAKGPPQLLRAALANPRVCACRKKTKLSMLPARPFTALEACIPRKRWKHVYTYSLSATGNKSVLKSNRSDEQIKIVPPESDFFVDADQEVVL
jgi:hypothetical protein